MGKRKKHFTWSFKDTKSPSYSDSQAEYYRKQFENRNDNLQDQYEVVDYLMDRLTENGIPLPVEIELLDYDEVVEE